VLSCSAPTACRDLLRPLVDDVLVFDYEI